MMKNRYPGTCDCGTYVSAGDGYYNGSVTCSPEKWGAEVYEYDGETVIVETVGCEKSRQAQARQTIVGRRRRAEIDRGVADPDYVSADEEAQREIERRRAELNDPVRLARIAAEKARRAAEDAAWAADGLVRCDRCGGIGHSEAWRNTGYSCFDCNGIGAVLA